MLTTWSLTGSHQIELHGYLYEHKRDAIFEVCMNFDWHAESVCVACLQALGMWQATKGVWG